MKIKNKSLIGAIHLQAMPGFNGFTSVEDVIKNAQLDLENLQNNGIDAVIFENNYDLPHKIYVNPETVSTMTHVIDLLKPKIKVPFGVSVLWNDYRAALSICQSCRGSFIRVPAFVDDVITEYGIASSVAHDVHNYQKSISATNISIFTDIHVKHSQMINTHKTLVESALEAKNYSSNGLIITGKWTGDQPQISDLMNIKQQRIGLPIIIGSGVNKDNLPLLFPFADYFIVSTSLKIPSGVSSANIYDHNSRFSEYKIRELVSLRNQLLLQ